MGASISLGCCATHNTVNMIMYNIKINQFNLNLMQMVQQVTPEKLIAFGTWYILYKRQETILSFHCLRFVKNIYQLFVKLFVNIFSNSHSRWSNTQQLGRYCCKYFAMKKFDENQNSIKEISPLSLVLKFWNSSILLIIP